MTTMTVTQDLDLSANPQTSEGNAMCCSSSEQATCCLPEAKASCCGDGSTSDCGCS